MQGERFSFFIAQRLFSRKVNRYRPTAALLHFTVTGIALSLLVMLLTVFVGNGFRNEVRRRVSLLTGEVILSQYGSEHNSQESLLQVTPDMIAYINSVPGVAEVQGVLQTAGIVKTKEDYEGVLLMGVTSTAIYHTLPDLLLAGTMPQMDGTDTLHNPILLSSATARRLHLTVGDKIAFYFTGEGITLRSFTLAGIVDLPQINGSVAIAPIEVIRTALKVQEGAVNRLELFCSEGQDPLLVSNRVATALSDSPYAAEQSIGLNLAEDVMPDLFSWLDMLDSNIALLLLLLLLVAAFTLITGLLILILDRTRMIGLLKALGTNQAILRNIFLYLAMFVIGKGMLWGNLLALVLLFLQEHFHFLTLNPATYYVSYVPMEWSWRAFLSVNMGTFALSMLLLLLPTRIIARMRPIDTIRFNQ